MHESFDSLLHQLPAKVRGFMVLGASMVEERPTSGCRICLSSLAVSGFVGGKMGVLLSQRCIFLFLGGLGSQKQGKFFFVYFLCEL